MSKPTYYDTEEYIAKVMRIEKTDRQGALKLIEEFKKIDREMNEAAGRKRYASEKRSSSKTHEIRMRYKKEKRCTVCGRQDESTLSGKSRCYKCIDAQKKVYERWKQRNGKDTMRQGT